MKLSPIVLFVFNRPLHTRRTIEALQRNELASQSSLYIYSDGPKQNVGSDQLVDEVREYINTVTGFERVTVISRNSNWGLSRSIIDGVSNVISDYGKVIVMEDDLVTSPYFLTFMNQALEFYWNQKRVWHISGWNYPIACNNPEETFLWRVMNCWGWATWADRWDYFEKDASKLIEKWNKDDIRRFNLDGTENFWNQVTDNYKGKINTWAIFWYATIFNENGLCLNPVQTLVDNIGHDGKGEHCSNIKSYVDDLSEASSFNFSTKLIESERHVRRIKQHLHTSLIQKIRSRLLWK